MPPPNDDVPLAEAFPLYRRPAFARYAAQWLTDAPQGFRPGETVVIGHERLCVPPRIYIDRRRLVDALGDDDVQRDHADLVLALGSRHHDGYFRESCVRQLLRRDQAWLLPYVLSPLGEYVLEIGEAVIAAWDRLDAEALAGFARDNPAFVARLRRRATSYWDCYYRKRFPRRDDYPPWQALTRLPCPTPC